ncbi:hypothetical protein L3V82_05585 [Thiotrichales bacterium 19S3-7]|nr:hypothetical protein [Thiotrichales bacterium 19S3-7]MCF6801565.1 hypothetical protein [Thiotrichales bacterium 19S3-11]
MNKLTQLILGSMIILPVTTYASTFSGPCSIKNQTQESVTCNGPATLKQSTITGDVTINGPAEIDEVTIDGNLTVHGQVSLDKTAVKGITTVNGPLKADDSTLATLTIHGPLKIDESTISGKTTIAGLIDADETTFNNTVTASTNIIKLEESTIRGDLIVSSDQPPMVTLSDKSVITGEVIFKKVSGSVLTKDNQSKTGNVKNGSKIQHSS